MGRLDPEPTSPVEHEPSLGRPLPAPVNPVLVTSERPQDMEPSARVPKTAPLSLVAAFMSSRNELDVSLQHGGAPPSCRVPQMAGVSPRGIFVSHEQRATLWDAERPAALRVAPRKSLSFVVRPSSRRRGRGMLPHHALPRGNLGATKVQRFAGCDTSMEQSLTSRGIPENHEGHPLPNPSQNRP